ncbi:MAG: DUF1501 domain-containing protein [Pseudomonadota bacterium]
MDRRVFLKSSLVGCSLAASPLLTPVSFAAAPWDTRLVVIILRGGMDGLDAVRPVGDKNFASVRQRVMREDGPDLNGFYALHPALSPLMPLWKAGELSMAQAVSTPYRDKRSHFDGQDILEAGTPDLNGQGVRDGWLNRLLQNVPGVTAETSFAIGREALLITKGKAPVSEWSPDARLNLSPQAEQLLGLISEADPAIHSAMDEALRIAQLVDFAKEDAEQAKAMAAMDTAMESAMTQTGRAGRGEHVDIARFAALRLREETRIATFSLGGWDTHRNQATSLATALGRLSETILTLKAGLGSVWEKTAVLAMTEFGRTVRENGTAGTDHGTGGAMFMAGGAVRGRQVLGTWPGLDEADLYAGRDLMPTRDVRSYAAWAMRDLMGIEKSTLERAIFPGLEMGAQPQVIL